MQEQVPGYELELSLKVMKQWKALPSTAHRRINEKVKALAFEPRPPGCEKMEELDGYRVRVGDYRVVYTVNDALGIVSVVRIGHRKNVYRR